MVNRNKAENPAGWTPTFYGPDRIKRLDDHKRIAKQEATERREREERE